MATKITKSPTHKVANHTAPARDGNTLKSTWKIPSEETKDSNHRAQSQCNSWDLFYTLGKKTNQKITRGWKINSLSTTSSSVNINNFVTTSNQSGAKKGTTFTRKSFYPYTQRRLTRADHNVLLDNSHKNMGPVSTTTTTFSAPGTPTIDSWKFNTDTGTVSVKITAVKSTPKAERKLTKYTWKVQRGKYNATSRKFSVTETKKNETKSFGGGEVTLSYDCVDYQALKDGEMYLCTLTAVSQGFAGPSKSLTKKYVIAPPATATIKNPTITLGEGGRVTVPVSMNRKGVYVKSGNKTTFDYYANQVDGIILQAAVDVSAKTIDNIPGDAWDDIGAVDDGDCTYLTANTSDLTPSVNNYTYVRVKSWRFDADCAPMCRYSNIKGLGKLHTVETAVDDESAILELTPTPDGQGAYLLLGYDKKSTGTRDDADGTEVSWSESENAWLSTKQPSTFEVTWSSATEDAVDGDPGYPYKDIWWFVQQIYIDGLDEGVQYWFRCRRYNDDDNGTRTYGEYCEKVWGTATSSSDVATDATLIPTIQPSQVTLSAPTSTPTGSDIQLTWTYDGGMQTAYQIYLGGTNRIVASGNSSLSSYLLKRETYAAYVRSNNTLQIKVAVSTSKRADTFTESEWSTVTFAEAPVLEAAVPTITAQPASVYLYSTTAGYSANMTIIAEGTDGDDAIGIEPQANGDDVWSAMITPTWAATTWGETAWYANNVAPVVDAADDAWDALDITTNTFTGGTNASLVGVPVEDGEATRYYIVVQPSSAIGPYMQATLQASGSQWPDPFDITSEPVWCDSNGIEDDDGGYIRLPWPLSLYDDPDTETDEQTQAFTGCTVTLAYIEQSDENTEAWDEYTELRASADELVAVHDASEAVYESVVSLPSGIDFRDNAEYNLSATITSADSGLISNVATASFEVQWAHQAPKPDDGITVDVYDEVDEDGVRSINAYIQLAAPTGLTASDVADIWRVAADGWHCIAEGRAFTDLVVDEYAPFGDAELAYRVVSRTMDGDADWADYEYELNLRHTRIDFGDSYLELPFNIDISHSYTKLSEQREHLGESLPRGYWGNSHGRSFNISSDLIKYASREQRELLHELGRFMGPVLVRTPDGCCMEAEITPETQYSYDSVAVPVSIRGTEIELTQEHMAVADESEGEP